MTPVAVATTLPLLMLSFEPYLAQRARWPANGRHILAQHDATSVVVYQAFRPEIALEATELQRFGPSFRRNRMSWIKPNFLWMMFRCGWATKVDQERVLAIRLRRQFFEHLLATAVPSMFAADAWPSEAAWQAAVQRSEVRLQWDPDHDPSGRAIERRAIQLGLRGAALGEFAGPAILGIDHITEFVAQQRPHARSPFDLLQVPSERCLWPTEERVAVTLGLTPAT